VVFLPEFGAVVAMGWEKALRVFDPRAPGTAMVSPLQERGISMDAARDFIVVGETMMANKAAGVRMGISPVLQCFNMRMLQRPERDMISPLRMQTRVVKVFPDASSFVVASVEGRCSVRLREGECT
jgi:mRNA export factor